MLLDTDSLWQDTSPGNYSTQCVDHSFNICLRESPKNVAWEMLNDYTVCNISGYQC